MPNGPSASVEHTISGPLAKRSGATASSMPRVTASFEFGLTTRMRMWRFGLFPLREEEARQFVRVGRKIELFGKAVRRHIGMQRRPVGLLGDALDRGRI